MVETTCAIAASYPAKAFGIKTGTLVHEARRLCPDLQLVQAHHKLYVEYHHRILAAIDKHIPVEEVMSIDEVACRLDRVRKSLGRFSASGLISGACVSAALRGSHRASKLEPLGALTRRGVGGGDARS